MDLSSLKKEPMAEMLSSSSSEVVGLHPLFGPRVRSLKGKAVALCQGRGSRWKDWLKGFLESKGAEVVELEPEEHDRGHGSGAGLGSPEHHEHGSGDEKPGY